MTVQVRFAPRALITILPIHRGNFALPDLYSLCRLVTLFRRSTYFDAVGSVRVYNELVLSVVVSVSVRSKYDGVSVVRLPFNSEYSSMSDSTSPIEPVFDEALITVDRSSV